MQCRVVQRHGGCCNQLSMWPAEFLSYCGPQWQWEIKCHRCNAVRFRQTREAGATAHCGSLVAGASYILSLKPVQFKIDVDFSLLFIHEILWDLFLAPIDGVRRQCRADACPASKTLYVAMKYRRIILTAIFVAAATQQGLRADSQLN
jgi:hypothetical protein